MFLASSILRRAACFLKSVSLSERTILLLSCSCFFTACMLLDHFWPWTAARASLAAACSAIASRDVSTSRFSVLLYVSEAAESARVLSELVLLRFSESRMKSIGS